MESEKDLDAICLELQQLQRYRVTYMKSRIMIANRLQSNIAVVRGYFSGMSKEDGKKAFDEAGVFIKNVIDEKEECDEGILVQIQASQHSIGSYVTVQKNLEKSMVALVKQLPVYDWVIHKDQRGFGEQSLAVLIGETGNIRNYSNPAKLWKRMGCAPYDKNGEVLMGATWKARTNQRKLAKLSTDEWEEYGYSPRRRSVTFLFGEGIVKQNYDGPYRLRYDTVKAGYGEKHPDRVMCSKCQGSGMNCKGKCANCKGTKVVMLRAHRHAMLLATKLLLKNLWIEWWGEDAPKDRYYETVVTI